MRGAEQSTEALPPHHVPRVAIHCPLPRDQLVVETLVIALCMRVVQVWLDRIRQGACTQYDPLLQGLLLDGTYEPFAMRVQVWAPRGSEDRFHPTSFEQPIEGLRALRVSVVEQVALTHKEPLQGIRELSRTLRHEGRGGMRGDPGNLDAPRGQFHHHEDIIGHQTVPRRHLHGEEVRRGQHLPVHLQALRPTHARLAALRRRLSGVPAQDVAHGDLVENIVQVRQGPLDTAIPPRGILFCHAYDKLLDLLGDTRSPKLLSLGAPVELLRDQSLVPAQEGVRGGKGRDLFETFAPERVGERRKAAALAVRQAQPSAPVVGFENAVFLLEIRNDVLLVTSPAPARWRLRQ